MFEAVDGLEDLCAAAFLRPGATTPVFVRFSTVAGSCGRRTRRGDVRGFATKFYTAEGIWDLVGNNIPVFFIQDGIKFPDVIHAVKPHPDREIPQAQSAHDTFWDFVSLQSRNPRTCSCGSCRIGRSRARSQRWKGSGVHTFRF